MGVQRLYKQKTIFQCFCAMTLFYCAHWQTYVSGTLRFGKVDVTEAQCTIMAIHMISAIFGPNIWMLKVSHWQVYAFWRTKFQFPFFRYFTSNNSIFRIIILRFLNICIKHYCCCSSIWIICDSYLLSIASKFSFGLKGGSRFVIWF